jgi:hypothetical protein
MMKRIRYIQAGWVVLLVMLVLGLAVTPAGAASGTTRQTTQRVGNTTSVNATIYITLGTLRPLFQNQINQQVPGAVNSVINTLVSKLPHQDQGWATQMATTLIQPSATLTSLTTQPGGLATSLRLSLYPGDPHPILANELISLSVIDSSTIQVSAKPLNGSPALVNGPLTTFQISIGQLSSISTTPTCGDASLAVSLQFPVALGQSQANSQVPVATTNSLASISPNSSHLEAAHSNTATSSNSYVELPASSLASIGNSVGGLPIGSGLMAKNIQIGIAASNLLITSDIFDSFWGKIGTAVTTVAPMAAGGNLAVHVLNTNLTILNIFTFPYNSYNQQIEKTLNTKLNGALKGKFYVSQAAIGPNAHVPCAAKNSLVLTGTANLG